MNRGQDTRGPIAWFARNHVAANLLMAFILISGAMSLIGIKQEVFPEINLDMISIQVPYPGASPADVEEGICQRIEERVVSVEGIKSIQSRAVEGMGSVLLEVERGLDISDVLDEVKSEVDRIDTFPEEAEEPVVVELSNARQVINLVVYGDVPERTLKVLAEKIRDDLTALPNISYVSLAGVRDYQISVEVSEENLRRYGLTFDQVARAVKTGSVDLPGGSVKTDSGEILIRTKGQKYTGPEFEKIVVITRPDGTSVRLGDIARVVDGFDEDTDLVTRFDGKPAAMIQVYRVGEQDAIDVAGAVHAYVADQGDDLPEGVQMAAWKDDSLLLKSRKDLLIRNGRIGLALVFICLMVFLDLRLAFWVTMGIPISFMGAFWLIPHFGVSVNMISLFAFIISLGIVVDDAIVVGENVFAHWESGKSPIEAAIDGTREMLKPVTFAILTTVAAFMPILFVEGNMGKFMGVIPVVVISVLMVSLVEAVLILPAHLSSLKKKHHNHTGSHERPSLPERYRRRFGVMLNDFISGPYRSLLSLAVEWRYVTIAVGLALLLSTIGYALGGGIKFSFLPKVDSDNAVVRLSMPRGTSLEETSSVVKKVEDAAARLRREVDGDRQESSESIVKHVFTMIGAQTAARHGVASSSGSHVAEVNIQLLDSEHRDVPSASFAARWRELTGELPDVESITFSSSLFTGGNAIEVRLTGDRFDTLREAAGRLKRELATFPGVSDISDTFREGKMEMALDLKPAARTLGITLEDLARQVRQGYYGDEAVRLQRGRDDLKVMVRYPDSERRSLGDIEKMRVRTPSGAEVPFSYVARVRLGRGYASINREERQRVVSVIADVDDKRANAEEVIGELKASFLPGLMADYPGLRFSMEGEQKSRRESMSSLGRGFIVALFGIYALLAVPFRSYTQPLIVMSAIPFGIVGALWGHVLMGLQLTILSMFGIVALSGVVVNDSLIMIDYVNRARERGTALKDAVLEAGQKRFRPIILTTFTTFFGLLPMILERSVQARFLIPMAVSLGFGVLVATGITLLLVPAAYIVQEDIRAICHKIFRIWFPGLKDIATDNLVTDDD